MSSIDNTRKAFLLMMSTVMLASSGCGSGEVSKSKAEQIVIQNLEEKYGGYFEVRSVESRNIGVNAFKDHIYAMGVYSNTLQEEFTVEIFRDGTNMSDNYEEILYNDRVEEEINKVERDENGWTLDSLETSYRDYNSQQKSSDFEDFKKDKDKLVLRGKITIREINNDVVAESLYNYIEALQNLGYRISITIHYRDKVEMLTALKRDEAVTLEAVMESISNLEA